MESREQSLDERYEMITRNLEDVVNGDELKKLLEQKPHPCIYWGTAITGKPHVGYFVPIYKIADYLKAGCEVKILFADLHGFLDHQKTGWDLLQHRYDYYKFVITEMFRSANVPVGRLAFLRGTDYQLSAKYTLDVYKMASLVTNDHVLKAGAEVVKQSKHPYMSSLMYPILQALDEEYLDADIQFGGIDQRKIFMFAREWMPKLGYKKRLYLMNPLIPGLNKSGKMSSSEPQSKINFDDSDELIRSKIFQAYSVDGCVEDNGLLALLKYVIFNHLRVQNRPFVVRRDAKWGGDMTFQTHEEVEEAFKNSGKGASLSSADLKRALADEMILLVDPLRRAINSRLELTQKAYPSLESPKVESAKLKAPTTQATIASLDIRVGKIIDVRRHEDADFLYVEVVDLGPDVPHRTVISGVVKQIPIEKMRDRLVLVLCNLPLKTMRNVTSEGMLLTATSVGPESEELVDLINVPQGSIIGERLSFGLPGEPDQLITKKRLDRILKSTKTDGNGLATYSMNGLTLFFKTSAGVCSSSLTNASIS
ncbi:tyrosine--tRNA ligase, cytoplasmic-like [Schistocerca gregaria]|uniref:tyrosine--tRNA ligase, cytoplasmic-like n=1 Tax=Schistocerca gregaria TaxID=7010 RepID=UPI00211E041F|nr:tyrosine--tRNA ligase, cytoplasmic-like [Schistocerca gregaria]